LNLFGAGGTTKVYIQKNITRGVGSIEGVINQGDVDYSFDVYTIPICTRNGRYEDFEKDIKLWYDLKHKLQSRTRGWRLVAEYSWENTEHWDDELEDILEIVNSDKKMFIQFGSIPRKYEVKVVEFKRGLADGLHFSDSVYVKFAGVNLINQYPNPDLFYMLKGQTASGTIFVEWKDMIPIPA
jgi:hypothetical protein